MKPSIFVVEDDPDISRLVRHHLENEGFVVRVYPTGTTVLADAERQRPALFVLDIMVPGKDGLEICRTIRQTPGLASVPVIFLTAKSSEADRVLGLELGADDYIAKPFSPRELVARVKAVLRRFERPLPPSPMKVGEIEIDPSAMTLMVRGSMVPTTATEFRLLDYFARHKGRVFSRDHLLDSVWRDTAYVTPRSVDVYVRRIREKIEPDPENPRYLKTVRGAGYRFEVSKIEEKLKNRIFFKLLAVFLIVIAATAAILYVMIGNAWEASLRAEIERNLKQKTLLFAHRVEIDHTHTLADIAAQEGQAAGARATVIDASGKVLADSESNPAEMENHAKRVEFAAALAGQTGENERRSATLGIPFLYVAAPISGGAVRLAYPLSDIEAVQAQVRRRLLWGSAIASLIASADCGWRFDLDVAAAATHCRCSGANRERGSSGPGP